MDLDMIIISLCLLKVTNFMMLVNLKIFYKLLAQPCILFTFNENTGQVVHDPYAGVYNAFLGTTPGVDINDPTWLGVSID